MKTRLWPSFLILMSIVVLSACSKDDPKKKTDEQIQLEKLVGQWKIGQALNDTEDRTDEFTDFTLTISGTYVENGTYNYQVAGTRPNPSPWPGQGTWKFGANRMTTLIRDPNSTGNEIEMSYVVSDNQLEISFELIDGAGWSNTGRVQSVAGAWSFTLTKQ